MKVVKHVEELPRLNNSEIVDLYAAVVRVDHYDPFITPKWYEELLKAGIGQDTLKSEILRRMEKS